MCTNGWGSRIRTYVAGTKNQSPAVGRCPSVSKALPRKTPSSLFQFFLNVELYRLNPTQNSLKLALRLPKLTCANTLICKRSVLEDALGDAAAQRARGYRDTAWRAEILCAMICEAMIEGLDFVAEANTLLARPKPYPDASRSGFPLLRAAVFPFRFL